MGAASAVSAVALTGCNSSDSASSDSETSSDQATAYKLGGIGPVTGAAAIYGSAVKNAMTIAVDEINAAGGAVTFDYEFQDDEHNAEKSVNAYNNLKDWGMQVLIGTVTTAPAIAVSAEANADNMFMLTPSASSTDVIGGQEDADGNVTITRKGNTFQMCFTDPNQGTASAKYIKDQNLGSKIGVIYNNSDAYSTGIYKKFEAEAAELGLDIVSTTTFTDDTATDFSVQLNDCKNAGADLVFLPIYYTPAALILAQAASMGYEPKWFGVDGMDGILTLDGFDTSLAEGVMLLTPFSADAEDEKTQAFVKAYQDAYGETPNQFAADGYDCVYAVAAALEKAECTPDMDHSEICDKLVAVFTDPEFTFDGLTGTTMTWDESGEVSKDPKGMVIQDGAYVGM
jgi:branched-chain amino acid transport system substrate-binding protein